MTFKLINRTPFETDRLQELTAGCVRNAGPLPDFVLIVDKPSAADGFSATADRPIVVIFVRGLSQFKRVLAHELCHLKQHQAGYADEKEAYAAECLVSEHRSIHVEGRVEAVGHAIYSGRPTGIRVANKWYNSFDVDDSLKGQHVVLECSFREDECGREALWIDSVVVVASLACFTR